MKTFPPTPSLKINSAWTFAGNITYGVCQWTLTAVIAWFRGPETLGQYALAMAIVIPIFSFFNMHLRAVQATDTRLDYQFTDYFCLRLATTGLALLITAGIAFTWDWQAEMSRILLYAGAMKASEALNDLAYGNLQQGERMSWISISMIARGLFWIIGANAVIVLGGDLWQALLVIGSGNLVLFFSHDLRRVYHLRLAASGNGWNGILPRFHWPTLRKLFALSFPLALIYMLVLLNSSMPRYFLAWSQGIAAVGIFDAFFKLTMPLSLALNSVGQAASPRFAKYYADRKIAAFWRLILKIGGLGLALGIASALVVFFFHKPIISLCYGEKFVPYSPLLFLVFLACLPSNFASGFGYAMTATRLWRKMLGGYILTTVLYIGACALLIPAYELNGAAGSIAARSFINITIIYILLRQAVRIAKSRGKTDELP